MAIRSGEGIIKGVRERIRAKEGEIIKDLIRFCSQPSISAQGIGIAEMAELVIDELKGLGARVERIDFDGGNPIVYGELRGKSDRTLLLYNHYDVQPPDPLDEWFSPPFEPVVRDGKVYGRGTSDNKGDFIARLHAVKAFLEVNGSLPINVKFLLEGEEEIGSVHLRHLVEKEGELLKADGCIWEGGGRGADDRIEISLGCKGIVYAELEVKTAEHDLHSSNATIAPNPAWRLVWALSTLKNEREEIMIEGFYDGIRDLTPEELATLNDIAGDDSRLKESLGLQDFLLRLSGVELMKRHLLSPTCTICGFVSGYTGKGAKTVLPNRARAKLDFRLVPDQDPDDIREKVERHLIDKGFSDIKVTWFHGEHPYRAPLDSRIVKAARASCREVYNAEPRTLLTIPGTGPMYELSGRLGIPTVALGVGYAGSAMHGPNENIRIRDLILGAETIASIFTKFVD